MALRRGFDLAPGEPVVVVEDVITTGGSTREVMEAVRGSRGGGAGRGQPRRPQRRDRGPGRAAEEPAHPRRADLARRGLPALRRRVRSRRSRARARAPSTCPSTASPSPTTAPTSRAGRPSARAARTVQGELEKALARLAAGRRVAVAGAGRTDAGVHALGQVASFDLPRDVEPGRARPRPERAARRRRARDRGRPRSPGVPRAQERPGQALPLRARRRRGRSCPQRRRSAGHVPWTLDEAGRWSARRGSSPGGTTSRPWPRPAGRSRPRADGDALGGRVRVSTGGRDRGAHAALRGRGRRLPAQDGAEHGGRAHRGRAAAR